MKLAKLSALQSLNPNKINEKALVKDTTSPDKGIVPFVMQISGPYEITDLNELNDAHNYCEIFRGWLAPCNAPNAMQDVWMIEGMLNFNQWNHNLDFPVCCFAQELVAPAA